MAPFVSRPVVARQFVPLRSLRAALWLAVGLAAGLTAGWGGAAGTAAHAAPPPKAAAAKPAPAKHASAKPAVPRPGAPGKVANARNAPMKAAAGAAGASAAVAAASAASAASVEPGTASPSGRLHEVERRHVRSISGDVPTSVRFANRSGARIRIHWLDYQGMRKLYQTLDDGAQYVQKTFITHPWLVTDERNNALSVYFPDAQPRTITILPRG